MLSIIKSKMYDIIQVEMFFFNVNRPRRQFFVLSCCGCGAWSFIILSLLVCPILRILSLHIETWSKSYNSITHWELSLTVYYLIRRFLVGMPVWQNEEEANTVDIMSDNVYQSKLTFSTYFSHPDNKSSSYHSTKFVQ